MAIAKPKGMTDSDFVAKVEVIRQWFAPLNPYAEKGPLLKFEDVNFAARKREGNEGLRTALLPCDFR